MNSRSIPQDIKEIAMSEIISQLPRLDEAAPDYLVWTTTV